MKPSGIDPTLRDFLGLALLCTLGAAYELYIDPKDYQYTGTLVDKSSVAERPWEPIRFKFFLDESMFTKVNTAQREYLKRVLKESLQFYSDSNVRVQRDPNGLAADKTQYGRQFIKGHYAADFNETFEYPESAHFFKCPTQNAAGCMEDANFEYLDADMVILVIFIDHKRFVNTGAAATPYGFDVNTKRPNMAFIVITRNTLFNVDNYSYRKGYETLITVIRHEIGHALGIGSLTAKYPNYAEHFVNSTREKVYPETEDADNAKEVFLGISFSTALAEAQKYFDCPDLEYLEYENGGGSGSLGAHFEFDFLPFDTMRSSVPQFPSSFSSITLALLEDSGWYKVNLSKADPLPPHFDKDPCLRAKSCKMSDYTGQLNYFKKCQPDRKSHWNPIPEYEPTFTKCYHPMMTRCSDVFDETSRCLEHDGDIEFESIPLQANDPLLQVPVNPDNQNFPLKKKDVMTGGECYEIKCQGKKVFFVSKGVTYECKKAGEKIQLDEEYKHPNHYTNFFATSSINDFQPYEVLRKYKISRTVICPAYCEVCDEQDSDECCGSSTLSLILAFVLIFAFNVIF